MSSNPAHGEMYSMQHIEIKMVSDLRPGTPVSSTNKTDHHDIAEIVLKVALNTITLTWTRPFLIQDWCVAKTVTWGVSLVKQELAIFLEDMC
jgi:hypothetical protein